MRNSRILFMLFMGAYMHSYCQAVKDTTEVNYLDEVLVSDTKFESKRGESGKMVIRIGQEELSQSIGQSLAEIINRQAGIEINGSRSRPGEVLGVYARGGRGRQLVVFVDGVRVSDPSSFAGTYDLRLLNPASIDNIEIIKGANSTLYGANAATAVLYITTKKAENDGLSAQISSSVGTNQTAKNQNFETATSSNNIAVNGRLSNVSFGADFGHSYADGISSIITDAEEEDKNTLTTTAAHLGWQPSEQMEIRLRAAYKKLATDYDESFGLQDAPYRFLSEQKGISLSSEYRNGSYEIHLKAGTNSFKSKNISAFPGIFEGRNTMIDLYSKIHLTDRLNALAGLSYQNESAELSTEESFAIWDPYIQLQGILSPKFRVNAGARLNSHSTYDTQLVYSVNPVFTSEINSAHLKIFGSYSSAYLTPTLNQLYGDFGANDMLEPERNVTTEIGTQLVLENDLQITAVFFDREEENAVIFDNSLFQYENAAGKIDVLGIEMDIGWRVYKSFRLKTNFTFTERQGDDALRIPKHKAALQGFWSPTEETTITLQYMFTSKRMDTDFNTFSNEVLDGYSLINLHVAHDLIDNKFKVFAQLDNLLNKEYTEVLGFNTRGRNLRLGLLINL